ncbi:hypothetical protein ACHAXH_003169 [Discostella pseudostelligera]
MTMTTQRARTSYASLLLVAILSSLSSCRAFAPSPLVHDSLIRHFRASSSSSLLSATSTSIDDDNYNNDNGIVTSSRRSFLLSSTALTTSLSLFTSSQLVANAADESSSTNTSSKLKPLSTFLYLILRVREATEQESRLISTGKFKDIQRANVKLAIKFMINNYKLSDSIIAASSYLAGNARVSASGVGQSAVQSLYTIVEYFDSSDIENIKVDSLAGKEAIVINGLKSVRRDLDEFLSYFPAEVVEEARSRIATENELNFKEFDPKLGAILNPNPVPAAKGA